MQRTHPFVGDSSISDELKTAVFELLTLGSDGIKSKREQAFEYWEKV